MKKTNTDKEIVLNQVIIALLKAANDMGINKKELCIKAIGGLQDQKQDYAITEHPFREDAVKFLTKYEKDEQVLQ